MAVACDNRGWPVLDLSQLLEPGVKMCVRCFYPADARNFVSAMVEQYPDRSGKWVPDDDRINSWYSNGINHIDFYPDLNGADGVERLEWDDRDYAERNGYWIVEFDELPMIEAVKDLGVLVAADELLDTLLS